MNVNTEHSSLLAGSDLTKSFRDFQLTCFTFDCLKHHQL